VVQKFVHLGPDPSFIYRAKMTLLPFKEGVAVTMKTRNTLLEIAADYKFACAINWRVLAQNNEAA
jgi:hypothetical protein